MVRGKSELLFGKGRMVNNDGKSSITVSPCHRNPLDGSPKLFTEFANWDLVEIINNMMVSVSEAFDFFRGSVVLILTHHRDQHRPDQVALAHVPDPRYQAGVRVLNPEGSDARAPRVRRYQDQSPPIPQARASGDLISNFPPP